MATPRPRAGEREQAWYFHAKRALSSLTWLHLRNEMDGPIPCPTGDPLTCPKCITMTDLAAALADAEQQFVFGPDIYAEGDDDGNAL